MAATSTQAAITSTRPGRRSPYRFYVVGVLALMALLNTMDQSILSVTSPAIQAEFQLSDAQIGFLSSAFVVVYGLTALPAGYWVDRYSRRAIVGVGVALWSLCTLLTGFTHGYPQLFAARTRLGTGEATILPAGVSLLGDYFSKRDRGRAAGILQAALQVGLALALLVDGLNLSAPDRAELEASITRRRGPRPLTFVGRRSLVLEPRVAARARLPQRRRAPRDRRARIRTVLG